MYVAMITLSYLGLANIWIQLLCENVKLGLSPHVSLQVYKEQLILNKLANSILSCKLIPTFLICGGFVLAHVIITLIKTFNEQTSVVRANFIIVMILLLLAFQYIIDVGGKLWKNSLEFKRQLAEKTAGKGFSQERRIMKACIEARIYMRDDFYFKSATYFSYLEWILNYVMTFILATTGY